MAARQLADPPFQAIAHDCIPDPGRHRDAHAGAGAIRAPEPEEQEVVRLNFTATLLNVNVF